eukprot:19933-Chlamydomonas_euryale.AAC.1
MPSWESPHPPCRTALAAKHLPPHTPARAGQSCTCFPGSRPSPLAGPALDAKHIPAHTPARAGQSCSCLPRSRPASLESAQVAMARSTRGTRTVFMPPCALFICGLPYEDLQQSPTKIFNNPIRRSSTIPYEDLQRSPAKIYNNPVWRSSTIPYEDLQQSCTKIFNNRGIGLGQLYTHFYNCPDLCTCATMSSLIYIFTTALTHVHVQPCPYPNPPPLPQQNLQVLYCAKKAGVTHVLKAGGAQAVAAMAWGTDTCPKVRCRWRRQWFARGRRDNGGIGARHLPQ